MAGRGRRNDEALAEALGMLASMLGGNPNGAGIGVYRKLGYFHRNNPPLFKDIYNLEGAQKWLKEIERIFQIVIFPEAVSIEYLAMTARQVSEAVEDGAAIFMLFVSMEVKGKAVSGELPVVCEFPEVFPKDVRELPPEREVEFAIDLIPGTSPVLMVSYRMSASELAELKTQLE
ncbi:uncharacterized protein LOC131659509 [Vicia villosa]|uniref:uncharacterized protein LOC131659509 n=1 Tax=Vicia villosa TaxID=3911 RepID=UPI00273B7293|nr:uncharacterized protein LOC131659509 [Vicia villosa]